MGGKLIDACSSLEAEDIDVKVLACKRKTVLSRKLTSDWDAIFANEERFLLDCLVCLQTYLIHFDKSVICGCDKLQSFVSGRRVNEDHICNLLLLYQIEEGLARIDIFKLGQLLLKFLWITILRRVIKILFILYLIYLLIFLLYFTLFELFLLIISLLRIHYVLIVLIEFLRLQNLLVRSLAFFWVQLFENHSRSLTKLPNMYLVCLSFVWILYRFEVYVTFIWVWVVDIIVLVRILPTAKCKVNPFM